MTDKIGLHSPVSNRTDHTSKEDPLKLIRRIVREHSLASRDIRSIEQSDATIAAIFLKTTGQNIAPGA